MAFALGSAFALLAPALAGPVPLWLRQVSARRLSHEYEQLILEPCSSFPEHLCSSGRVDEELSKWCLGEGDCLERCRQDCEDPDDEEACQGHECGCGCDPIQDKERCCKPADCSTMDSSLCPSGHLNDDLRLQCLTATCTEADILTCCKTCDLCSGKYLLPNDFYSSSQFEHVYCPRFQEECTIIAGSTSFESGDGLFEQMCSRCSEEIDHEECCSTMDARIPTRLFVTEFTWGNEYEYRPREDLRSDIFISLPTRCGDLTDNQWAYREEYVDDSEDDALQACLGMCLADDCCLAARVEPYSENESRCYLQNDCDMDAFFDHMGEFKNRETYDERDTLIGKPCETLSDCTFFRTTMQDGECFDVNDPNCIDQVEVTYDRFNDRINNRYECTWEGRQEREERQMQAVIELLVVSIVSSCCYCCCYLGCCYWIYKQQTKSKMQSAPAAVPVAQANAVPVGQVVGVATPVAAPPVAVAQAVAVPAPAAPVPVAVAVPNPTGGSRFCSNCGHSLPPGAGFCAECGTKVQGAAPAAAAPPTEPE